MGASLGKLLLIAGLGGALAGCAATNRLAVNAVGDALSGGGNVYTSDNDPELIREALPFGLKTFESLLEVSPQHKGLLLASANGFAAYAYMLQQDADRLDDVDLAEARRMHERASKLFLRGRDFALRGLEVAHPGFGEALRRDSAAALRTATKSDVDFLYWAGAAWAGALSADKANPDLIADLPLAGALVSRVIELDETYGNGGAHEFLISYEGGRPGGDAMKAREHYRRALELSQGKRASVPLALAESVDVAAQNLSEFRTLLAASLAVDIERAPEYRLVNTMTRRRAEWLQGRLPKLFLDADDGEAK